MNVLYCGDKNIADGLIISILSLVENIKESLNVYVLTMELETENKIYEALPASLEDFLDKQVKKVNSESSVSFIDVGQLFCQEMPAANIETRFTPCCMLRLFADLIPSLPDRILYLDNDVICRDDCSEFYYQDMKEYEVAGVLDYYGKWFFKKNPFRFDYLNSGVLLLNMKKICQTELFKNCRRRCREKKMFMPDQSAINKLAQFKKILPRKYNEQRKLKSDTVFQHFTTSFRFLPWFHTVTVKPWQIDKMHDVLNIYEYDRLLDKYLSLKAKYENRESVCDE